MDSLTVEQFIDEIVDAWEKVVDAWEDGSPGLAFRRADHLDKISAEFKCQWPVEAAAYFARCDAESRRDWENSRGWSAREEVGFHQAGLALG